VISRILPVAGFVVLVVLLIVGLRIADKKTDLPSPLINKPVPEFDLPVLAKPDVKMSKESLLGKPYLVNFWGSWCVTCRAEHPVVTQLAKLNKVYIVGVNFRDEQADALAWLQRWGNPYDVTLVDYDARTSIDFGVYAAPESFLVDPSGTIVFKQLGQLTWDVVENEILPRVAKMEPGN
jgi:cytochrome c biogenesis protein CcmG, thiol:disulfide interchange protein DsbE